MSLHLGDIPIGGIVPWQGVRWVWRGVQTDKRGRTFAVLQHPDNPRSKMRLQDWSAFGRHIENLWSLTRPHCYGQPRICGWCAAGLFAEADTEAGGAIAELPWHDDD